MSFWEREINIWRLLKPSKLSPRMEDLESGAAIPDKKLVAKILIKGEANISSASLSADGNLLAVSTVSDIKVFELCTRKPKDGYGFRIIKVDTPSSFSSGARHVQYSPDGKWLCIVRPDNKLFLSRTVTTSSPRPPLTRLERINRKIEKHTTLGGLGTYNRTITQVEFSSDSRILAVSDLAGYIDTFVLSGAEDLTLPASSLASSAASSSSSSLSDEELDSEEDTPNLIFGQHWTRNPSAASIPRLPSVPTVLSFRPSTTITNGTTHAIPTRHNPNPISHDLPTGEDRLLVITATSEIYEFDILRGSLSSWSRRNPTSVFPEEFRKVRDLARGCIWDVSSGRERVWLYGVGWLWMFDLSRDFPSPVMDVVDGNGKSKKRKRNGKEEASGAGSMVPDHELGTGMSRTMQRIVHGEVDEVEEIAFHNFDDDMDVDSDSDADGALMRFQRSEREQDVEKQEDTKSHHWHTFKYRPILGICVVGEGESEVGPEVALVERPIWEVELTPRYFGEQEWEKGGV